jgi:hypothetical protein
MPWTTKQREFLANFYGEITDPDMKISLLTKTLGHEIGNFHVLTREMQSLEDSHVVVTTKIACLEYELLEKEKLLIPDYR